MSQDSWIWHGDRLCLFLHNNAVDELLYSSMTTPTEGRAEQLIYPPSVAANSSITNAKFLSACFTGAAAGILGLQNWTGFVFFLVSTLATSAVLYSVNCKGNPGKYFQGGVMELVNPGQDTAFAFVLVWTLFYGTSFLHPSNTLRRLIFPCLFNRHCPW